jgi:hypothetical protein
MPTAVNARHYLSLSPAWPFNHKKLHNTLLKQNILPAKLCVCGVNVNVTLQHCFLCGSNN